MVAKLSYFDRKDKAFEALKPHLEKDLNICEAFSPPFQQFTPLQFYKAFRLAGIHLTDEGMTSLQSSTGTFVWFIQEDFLELHARVHNWEGFKSREAFEILQHIANWGDGIEVIRQLECLIETVISAACGDFNLDELDGHDPILLLLALKRAYFVYHAEKEGWDLSTYDRD